jgi:hypothetical protein
MLGEWLEKKSRDGTTGIFITKPAGGAGPAME